MPAIPLTPAVDINQGLSAFMSHNWYAAAAVLLMLGIQIVRAKEVSLWTRTPDGYRFLWPIGLAMVTAFLHAYLVGEPLKQAGLDVLNSLWQIALPAMGGAAALKESGIPWDGGAGGLPRLAVAAGPAPKPPAKPVLPPDLHLVPAVIDPDDRPTPVDPGTKPEGPPPAA